MKSRKVTSIWHHHISARDAYPELEGLQRYDFAVVGGGLTGISSAYHLRRKFPDASIVLLEASLLGSGASGRSGGQALNWLAGIQRGNLETARKSYGVTQVGFETAAAMARTVGAEHTLTIDGALELYTSPKRFEAAKREADRLRQAGIELSVLSQPELNGFLAAEGIYGGVLDPKAGQLDALRLIEAAAKWLTSHDVRIFENSPVLSVAENGPVNIRLGRGGIIAEKIVLAVNAALPTLGYLRNRVFPLHSFVMSSDPHPPEFWRDHGLFRTVGFSDDSDRISYGCLTHRGEFVFGGGSNSSYRYLFGNNMNFPGDGARAFRAIRQKMTGYLPGLQTVNFPHRWSGVLDLTFDRSCSIGAIGGSSRIFFAAGFSGHGLILTNLAGRVIADLIGGEDDRWRNEIFYNRRLRYIPPEPLRWVGYHIFTTLTGKSPRRNS